MTLQATNALNEVVLQRPLSDADAESLHRHPDTMTVDNSPLAEHEAQRSSTVAGAFDMGGFEIARKFVQHLVAEHAGDAGKCGSSARRAVGWEPLAISVRDLPSLEAAIGRVVVVADRLSREASSHLEVESWKSSTIEDPFFTFSLADVVPDFGPDRYRSRVARRFASMIGRRQAAGLSLPTPRIGA
jgi:hypothetical protein